jgi:hypothetical protein
VPRDRSGAPTHSAADAGAIPVAAFAAERVMLPREPAGRQFNVWLRAVLRAAGVELGRTLEMPSAPWDRRMLPVAQGDAVSVFVGEWAGGDGVVGIPFDPPLTMPFDLASRDDDLLVETALALRDAEGWLTRRGTDPD